MLEQAVWLVSLRYSSDRDLGCWNKQFGGSQWDVLVEICGFGISSLVDLTEIQYWQRPMVFEQAVWRVSLGCSGRDLWFWNKQFGGSH